MLHVEAMRVAEPDITTDLITISATSEASCVKMDTLLQDWGRVVRFSVLMK